MALRDRPSGLEIRRADDADIADVLAIARTAPWDKESYLRRQVALGNVLVAAEQAFVVGFVAWNDEFFSLPFVWLVVVTPERRRNGIAARLFAAVEERCAGRRLFSSTNASNAAMHRLLAQRGYRRSGEIDLDPGDPEVFYELDG
jgi:GNAT superfamily N-acetyltransferase